MCLIDSWAGRGTVTQCKSSCTDTVTAVYKDRQCSVSGDTDKNGRADRRLQVKFTDIYRQPIIAHDVCVSNRLKVYHFDWNKAFDWLYQVKLALYIDNKSTVTWGAVSKPKKSKYMLHFIATFSHERVPRTFRKIALFICCQHVPHTKD